MNIRSINLNRGRTDNLQSSGFPHTNTKPSHKQGFKTQERQGGILSFASLALFSRVNNTDSLREAMDVLSCENVGLLEKGNGYFHAKDLPGFTSFTNKVLQGNSKLFKSFSRINKIFANNNRKISFADLDSMDKSDRSPNMASLFAANAADRPAYEFPMSA